MSFLKHLSIRPVLAVLEKHDGANTASGAGGLSVGVAWIAGLMQQIQPFLAFGLTCLGLVATTLSIVAHFRKSRAKRRYRCAGCNRLNSVEE